MSEPAEPFLSRWSRLKHQGEDVTALDETHEDAAVPVVDEPDDEPVLTDADMPPLESLNDDDDFSGFLSKGVSPELRQKALYRLFRSPKFNLTDGLDDYAEDFTSFAPLGDIITADMKHQMERLLAKDDEGVEAEEVADSPTEETSGTAEAASVEKPNPAEEGSDAQHTDTGLNEHHDTNEQ